MEFTTASKVAIGTLVLGVAGYLGKEYILGHTIADLIKQNDPEKTLISSTISLYSPKWKDAWKQYLDDNKNKEKDVWGIPDWNPKLVSKIKKNHEAVPTSFIDACDSFSQTNVISTSSQLYKEVLKWCTSPTAQKISELIKEQGKRVLNKSDSQEDSKSGWKAALIKYLTVPGNPLGIDNLEAKQSTEELTKDKPVFVSFFKKCNELAEKSEGVTEDDISRVIAHCSVERTVKDLISDERPDRGFVDVSKIKDTTSPVALDLWTNYVNSNKDKEQDDWSVGEWSRKKSDRQAPKDFFKQCQDRSSKAALKAEPKAINELIRYCTHDVKVAPIYDPANLRPQK